ncbi:MAG: N-acetylneuraminate synthase family protein [Chloroflexi bacterium]|nr:N-acetylneuraminate synthase family protein [Chloroflexota bacterium]
MAALFNWKAFFEKREPVFIIAEVGSVHDGSFGNALKLIEVAAECKADAVKFQTHIAAAETLRDAPMPPYFKGEPRYEYFERTGFTPDQWQQLKAHSEQNGVKFLSSPFSEAAVELLESVGVDRYKVGSGETTNLPMLERIARTGKPVLLSSGMSSWDELDAAVNTIRRHHDHITVLQCTSEYPCPYEEVGLNIMAEMRARYGLPVGLSDHTLTSYASLAAVVLGASVIEKHLTFSRRMYGSDARHSLEPAEFADLVAGIRAVETMLRCAVDKDQMAGQMREMKQIFEKSVVTLVDIPAGTVITRDMIGIKKPGTGIPARRFEELIGKRAARNIGRDAVLQEEDLHA